MLNFKNIGIDNIFNLIENNIKYYYNCYYSYTDNRFNFTFIFVYPMEIPRRLIFEINILRVSPVKKLKAPHTETCEPGKESFTYYVISAEGGGGFQMIINYVSVILIR